jgi:flavin-binding protein dodecin
MDNNVYKIIELTGTSSTSIEDAVNNAVAKASQTVHKLRWFTVQEVRGALNDDAVTQWQVTVKVGFTLDS